MKTFKIGNDRSLELNKKNDSISIEEKGSKKAAHFTSARWASFLQCLDQIDDQLRKLSGGEDGRKLHTLLPQRRPHTPLQSSSRPVRSAIRPPADNYDRTMYIARR